jgi:NADH dehydrogenase
MPERECHAVTGAFSFTGRYIARRLLKNGHEVVTLTGHPDRDPPFAAAVRAFPFRFDEPEAMAESLAGASVLYNTYWIRFERGATTFDRAVANTAALLQAARRAGVRRVVHISIVHADEASPYPYFRAKGAAERLVRESGLACAILRPTVLFGAEGILFNNIAWMLRRFPVFAVPGRGDYRLQPLFVDDLAALAVAAGARMQTETLEAAGPEVFTFDELVRLIAAAVGSRARLLHVSPERALQLTRMIGGAVGDVVLTGDEIAGLTRNLLVAAGPPAGRTRFSQWLKRHAASLGTAYLSEIERHFR